MKNLFLFLLVAQVLFPACQGNNMVTANELPTAVAVTNKVATFDNEELANIQQKIYAAFVQSLMTQSTATLDKIELKLADIHQREQHRIVAYWIGYLQYYKSIYFLKNEDSKTAEKEIEKGIKVVKAIDDKNSEELALLSMLQSFSIQFKGMGAIFLSKSCKKYVKKAIKLDPENLRAYYVYASNDFYTPEQYGGGKEVETYLLKAIALPAQKMKSPYLPSWGGEQAYEMLVKHYYKKNDLDQAKKYLNEGISKYPQNYQLTQMSLKLMDK